jgi:twitching motility two-component system response regulator PilH
MGMLDTLKRWFGGGDKPAPARPAPQMRTPAPNPVVVPAQTPAPAPAPAPVVQPAPLTAAEALDVISKASAKPAPAPKSVERRERPRINAKDGTRVLIIDDSPTIVALLKRMLEQSGYTALEAVDAETGVALALSEVPDLIFLDIVLPGMNGFEALRRLRRDPISKTTPIIMISGNELATEQFYAQRIGADDFMKKPFSRSEVFARIEKLLDEDKVIRRRVAPVATIHAVASNPAAAPAAAAPAVVPVAAAPPAVDVPVAAPAAVAVAPVPVPLAAVPNAVPATTPAPPQQAASN